MIEVIQVGVRKILDMAHEKLSKKWVLHYHHEFSIYVGVSAPGPRG